MATLSKTNDKPKLKLSFTYRSSSKRESSLEKL
jgi:hypothetical protein